MKACVQQAALTATVATSLSKDKAAAGDTEQQLPTCSFWQLPAGLRAVPAGLEREVVEMLVQKEWGGESPK